MTRSLPIILVVLLLLFTVIGDSGGRHDSVPAAPTEAVMATAGNSFGFVSGYAESMALRVYPDTNGLRHPTGDEDWRVSFRSWLSVPDGGAPHWGRVLRL